MELIIGRDAATSKLKVIMGTQTKLLGNAASVPMGVSRQHCQINIDGNGTGMTITNLKVANVTYVNGTEVLSKSISPQSKIELGQERYPLPLSDILEWVRTRSVDLTVLRHVWETYNSSLLDITKSQGKLNAVSRISSVISMLAIASGFLVGRSTDGNPVYWMLYGLAIVLTVGFTVVSYRNASKVPDQKEELNKWFYKNYSCPSCGHYMGGTPYDILSQGNCCPFCKAEYRRK